MSLLSNQAVGIAFLTVVLLIAARYHIKKSKERQRKHSPEKFLND